MERSVALNCYERVIAGLTGVEMKGDAPSITGGRHR